MFLSDVLSMSRCLHLRLSYILSVITPGLCSPDSADNDTISLSGILSDNTDTGMVCCDGGGVTSSSPFLQTSLTFLAALPASLGIRGNGEFLLMGEIWGDHLVEIIGEILGEYFGELPLMMEMYGAGECLSSVVWQVGRGVMARHVGRLRVEGTGLFKIQHVTFCWILIGGEPRRNGFRLRTVGGVIWEGTSSVSAVCVVMIPQSRGWSEEEQNAVVSSCSTVCPSYIGDKCQIPLMLVYN